MRKKLLVMITTKDSYDYTLVALRSLFDTTALSEQVRVLIIDNDASFVLPEFFTSLHLTVMTNRDPRGFAANANSAMRMALGAEQDLYLLNNDLLFSPHWLEALGEDPRTIISPLSNREVQYGVSTVVPSTSKVVETFLTSARMDLSQYERDAPLFTYLMALHQRHVERAQMAVMVVPFFCVRIPYEVYSILGGFDEGFGKGGGEDYDYCLRAHLSGFHVSFQLQQFLFHFGGKSSWDGIVTQDEWKTHADEFTNYFSSKWGVKLRDFILHEIPLSEVVGEDGTLAKESENLSDLGNGTHSAAMHTSTIIDELIRTLAGTLPALSIPL